MKFAIAGDEVNGSLSFQQATTIITKMHLLVEYQAKPAILANDPRGREMIVSRMRFACLFLLATTIAPPAFGQGPDKDANAIAQALRDVDVKMTHPDPDLRVGYLETIVAEGNARKTERAIRIAVAGQDEGLRALGFRAYIASTGSIQFEIQITPQERKRIDDFHATKTGRLPDDLEGVDRVNGALTLVFEPTSIGTVRGFLKIGTFRSEYAMRGERLTFSGYVPFGGPSPKCNWDMRPTKDLKIIATMACERFTRPLQLIAPMY